MADVSGLVEAIQVEARRIMDVAAEIVVQATKDACPEGVTLALKESIEAVTSTDDGITYTRTITASAVGTNGFDYAEVSDTGHGDIFPENGPFLVFNWANGPRGDGTYRFAHVNPTDGKKWFSEPMPGRWADAIAEASG